MATVGNSVLRTLVFCEVWIKDPFLVHCCQQRVSKLWRLGHKQTHRKKHKRVPDRVTPSLPTKSSKQKSKLNPEATTAPPAGPTRLMQRRKVPKVMAKENEPEGP